MLHNQNEVLTFNLSQCKSKIHLFTDLNINWITRHPLSKGVLKEPRLSHKNEEINELYTILRKTLYTFLDHMNTVLIMNTFQDRTNQALAPFELAAPNQPPAVEKSVPLIFALDIR